MEESQPLSPRLAERRQLNAGPTFLELAAGPDGPAPLDRPTVRPPSDPARRLLLAIIASQAVNMGGVGAEQLVGAQRRRQR